MRIRQTAERRMLDRDDAEEPTLNGGADIEVLPASADNWTDLEGLFGRAGASNGCWCQYWLLGPGYHRRDRAANRDDLADQVAAGQAGLLARRRSAHRPGARPGAQAQLDTVGWARFGPRSELDYLTGRFTNYDFGDDDPRVLSCFYVGSRHRGSGVLRSLIRFAVDWGRVNRVPVEGYPIDAEVPGATRNRFPGILRPFLDAGFTERGRLARDRAVVRIDPE